jgi:hypothetical protein
VLVLVNVLLVLVLVVVVLVVVLVVESLFSSQVSTWAHPALQTRNSRGERSAQASFVTRKWNML